MKTVIVGGVAGGASAAARLRRPAERRLNPAGVGIYLQLNIQILYIFCILFNKFTAGFNIIAH